MAVPITALMSTIASAVANVNFRACQANGSLSAFQNADGAGLGRLDAQGHQREQDHHPQIGERGPSDQQPGRRRAEIGHACQFPRPGRVKSESQTPPGSYTSLLILLQPPRSAIVKRPGGNGLRSVDVSSRGSRGRNP